MVFGYRQRKTVMKNVEPVMKRKYDLLTAKDRKALPALFECGDDPIVHVKWFSPWSGWDWYVTSFNGDDIVSAHRYHRVRRVAAGDRVGLRGARSGLGLGVIAWAWR